MKTAKFFAIAAIVCTAVFTSCSQEDNPYPQPSLTSKVIGFEGATLNADGYWCGDETGTKFENYGSDAYACSYAEAGVTFPVNWTPAWATWTGFAISNRTATTFNKETMTPDQFNNCTGKAVSGQNFLVVQPYGETIDFGKAVTVKGFWYTNSAWVVDAILNGDV